MLILSTLRTQIKWILAVFIVIFIAAIPLMYQGGGSSGGPRQGDYTVAEINGSKLRISDLQRQLRSFVERNGIKDLTEKNMPMVYKAVLDDIVANRAIIEEVEKLKINVPADQIAEQVKAVESGYITKEQFMQVLASQGKTMKQFRAEVARELAIRKMLSDAAAGVTISDKEVETFYNALKATQFTEPAGINALSIDVNSVENAEKFSSTLKENGGDWDAAVAALGDAITNANKADTPLLYPSASFTGKYAPLADLKDGDLSAPIEMSEGHYLVIKRISDAPAKEIPFDKVKDSLHTMLLRTARQEAQNKFVKDLTDKMNVEILSPELFTPKEDSSAEKAVSSGETAAAEQTVNAEDTPDVKQDATAEETSAPEQTLNTEETPAAKQDVTAEETSVAGQTLTVEENPAAKQDVTAEETPAPEQDLNVEETPSETQNVTTEDLPVEKAFAEASGNVAENVEKAEEIIKNLPAEMKQAAENAGKKLEKDLEKGIEKSVDTTDSNLAEMKEIAKDLEDADKKK